MAVSYKKLWKILIDKGINKTQLRVKAEIGSAAIAKMGKGQQVSMDVLLRICKVLDCDIGDIVEVVSEVHSNE